jgi:hypothetical protein
VPLRDHALDNFNMAAEMPNAGGEEPKLTGSERRVETYRLFLQCSDLEQYLFRGPSDCGFR